MTPILCRGCGQRHDPLLTCARAARLAGGEVTNPPAVPVTNSAKIEPAKKRGPGRPPSPTPTKAAVKMRAYRKRKGDKA